MKYLVTRWFGLPAVVEADAPYQAIEQVRGILCRTPTVMDGWRYWYPGYPTDNGQPVWCAEILGELEFEAPVPEELIGPEVHSRSECWTSTSMPNRPFYCGHVGRGGLCILEKREDGWWFSQYTREEIK